MTKLLYKSKKGVTLVETVIAVVILALFAIGILSLLISARQRISETTSSSADYAMATQRLDTVISAISNGSSDPTSSYFTIGSDPSLSADEQTLMLNTDTLCTVLGFTDINISAIYQRYDTTKGETMGNIRGWYITLVYKDITLTGFASNTQGVFDQK